MVKIDNGTPGGVSGETFTEALEKARIFMVRKEEDGSFLIQECCDHFFSALLTRDELLSLADELMALAT